jgi:hypothetical protein
MEQITDMKRFGIEWKKIKPCEMCDSPVLAGQCANCGYVPQVGGDGTISPLSEDIDSRSVGSVLSRIPEDESVGSGGEYKR